MYKGIAGKVTVGEKTYQIGEWTLDQDWVQRWGQWKSSLKHPTKEMEPDLRLEVNCRTNPLFSRECVTHYIPTSSMEYGSMEKSYRVGDKLVRVGTNREFDWVDVPVGGVVEVDNVVNFYGWAFEPNTRWSKSISLCVGLPAGSRNIGGLSVCGCWKLISGGN